MSDASYLTEAEIDALQASDLHKNVYFTIRHVSTSMFSVARHFGGAKVNGSSYTYFPDSDELIRDDVLRWVTKRRKAETMTAKKPKRDTQRRLIEE